MAFNQNVPLSQLQAGPPRRRTPAMAALRGVSPNDVPYSDAEHFAAGAQQAGQLADRQALWQQQEAGPMAAHTSSPMAESQLAERLSPSWAAFGDAMTQQPMLAAGRGMKGSVDLVGEGPGSGTGIGSWGAQQGTMDPSGSFHGEGADINLDTLAGDANNPQLGGGDRTAAMRALQMLMKGGQ